MANTKYETIVRDIEQYYSPKCPIILSAYAVLLDTTDNKYGAQLKLTNCSGEQIDSVSLTVKTYDHFGNLSEEVKNCQYVNVSASYGSSFGTQTLIPLSKDVPVKNLRVTVNDIVFGNGSDWRSGDGAILENKLQLQKLTSVLSKEEAEAYCFIINSKMKYIPSQEGSFWVCSCGAANYEGQICNACGAEKEKVFLSLDKSVLQDAQNKKEYDDAKKLRKEQSVESLEKSIALFENLRDYKDSRDLATACREELVLAKKAAEEKRLEEEHQAEIRRKEREEKAKRSKKIAAIAVAIAAICVVAFFVVTKVIVPNNNYNAAVAKMESGDYEGAIDAFKAMNGYKDSDEKIIECENWISYQNAKKSMDSGDYSTAIQEFYRLDDFQDSKKLFEECKPLLYEYASTKIVTENYEKEDYTSLKNGLVLINGYKDVDQFINAIDGITAFKAEQYSESFEVFKSISPDFVTKYKEWYDGWYSASIYMNIFSAERITIDEALELYALVPESHLADNKEYFDALSKLKECTGEYRREKDLTEYTTGGPYYLRVNSYWLEKANIKADVQYDNFSGSLYEGTVSSIEGDEDYSFLISTTGVGSYTKESVPISIKIGSQKANFKTKTWHDICIRE